MYKKEVSEEPLTPVTWFLWLPSIWLFLLISRMLIGWEMSSDMHLQAAGGSAGASVTASGNTMGQIYYMSLFILGIIGLMQRKIDWESVIKRNLLLIICLAYMLLSLSWSDQSFVGFKRYFKTIGMMVMALIIVTEEEPAEAFGIMLLRSYGFLVLSSIILIVFFPAYGILNWGGVDVWVGVTGHKNQLGEISALGSIVWLWYLKKKGFRWRSKSLVVFIIAQVLLFNSQSMTSIVVFLFAISLFALYHIKIESKFVSMFLVYAYLMAGLLFLYLNNIYPDGIVASLFKAMGRDMTFTGRSELWKDLLVIGDKRPVFGYGYDSFWIGEPFNLWEVHTWKPNQGHSGYVDIYLTLGIVGFTLMMMLLLTLFISISLRVVEDYYYALIRMMLLASCLFFNISESSFCTSNASIWFVFLVTAVNAPKQSEVTDLSHEHHKRAAEIREAVLARHRQRAAQKSAVH